MANYYTTFSVSLPIPGTLTTERVKEWFDEWKSRVNTNDDESDEWESGDDNTVEWTGEEVWIHSDENGNVDAAVNFIQTYLQELNIEGGVWIGWAYTCSRPVAGAFGGGCAVVTKDDVMWQTDDQLMQRARDNEITVLNEC
jgi:hypothetical protein